MSTTATTPLKAGAQTALCLGALGVVFGDIGTSPLYTMKECITHLPAGVTLTEGVYGVLSLIFWALVLVVSIKYIWYVMRADNHGEGGIFALLALLSTDKDRARKHGLGWAIIMILIGAALLFGDGIITPAISPVFTPTWVAIIACVILAGLFWIQHKGTKRIGGIFGPIMLVWFAALGVFGAWHVYGHLGVFRALNPRWGWNLLQHSPVEISALLGAVVLAITGAEALYADMGHFGRRYIAIAWYGVAFPGLALNYFGQGAYILLHAGDYTPEKLVLALKNPEVIQNPFFALAPNGLPLAILTGLSILAAIIASQALISGAYSLTRQAIQLGYFPRLKINYTNAEHSGQIYVPFVNSLLAVGCILTVIMFGSTNNLAAAYGIAVTGTMAITTVAFYLVTQKTWKRARWAAAPICLVFLLVDLAFLGANGDKIVSGGWFPLAIGASVLAVMYTWKVGRQEIFLRVYGNNVTESELVSIARSKHVTRVGGSAVFMVGSPAGTPIALLHHVKANRCLHQTVVLLSIVTEEIPTVPLDQQLSVKEIGEGIWRTVGRYGYMESPDVGALLEKVRDLGVPINPQGAIYFFNREMIITDGSAPMWKWQKNLYSLLSRNARPVKDYYQITPSQIIEIGLPIQL